MRMLIVISSLIISLSCSAKEENQMQVIAERYVKLVLKVGQYDSDVVDAYHGPDDWKPVKLSEKEKTNFPNDLLVDEAEYLIKSLNFIDDENVSKLESMRKIFLIKQLVAVKAKVEMIGGKKFK